MDLSGSWEYIEAVSRSRLAHNQTKHHVSMYGEQIEIMGAAGEIVARRFLGLPEKLHDGFDGGTDINFHGIRIDVKATHLTPKVSFRFLQWPTWKDIKSPYILMTAINLPGRYGTVIGYATREEVCNSIVNSTRATVCHEIPITKLHPPYQLFEMLMQGVQ